VSGKRRHPKGVDAAAVVDDDDEVARDQRRIADSKL
jgi:hypothetical protein